MRRSFTNRLFGGVCGGLAQALPLRPWGWRLLFALLALVALPAALTVYGLLWWLLPQESLVTRRPRPAINTLLALLLSAAVLLLWLLLAGVFVFRQAQSGAYHHVLTGLALALLPALLLAGTLQIIPAGLYDLLLRAAPVLLFFFGASLLMQRRVPAGGLLALLVSAGLAAGVAWYAYAGRVDTVLDENQVTVSDAIPAGVTTLQMNIEVLATEIRFGAAAPGTRTITVRFSGSQESVLEHSFSDDGSGLATFTLRETRPNPYPRLESVGRGVMTVDVPAGIATSIAFAGESGNATFDLSLVNLERLNVDLAQGDALVTLPAYQPLSPGVAQNPGELAVQNGDLRIVLPAAAAGRFSIAPNSSPAIDETRYRIEIAGAQWLIIARDYDSSAIQLNYVLTVPRGSVRVDSAG
ncbi:MAG: PspC domain-containing protein [Anaerolineae bacterium]|nr:PspC domain-containing protein [Anaerolineae bacterium]